MLTALVLIPLIAALLIGFCKLPARSTALTAVVLNLLIGCMAFFASTGGCPTVSAFNFFQLTMASGIQQIMVFLTLIVTVSAVIGTKAPREGSAMWYNSTLLISAGALGAFLSDTLIGFFAFHELALIPTFLMIGIYGRGNRRATAWRATIYLGFASMVLLTGLVLLIAKTGCYSFSALAETFAKAPASDMGALIPTLLILGFGTLVSLFPFHSWAAPAYAAAPAPIAMMHAGVLKKFGLYGLFVLASVMPSGFFAPCLNWLLVLLVCNVLWVGWVTINQKRVDLMLGNSSVMHMGYIFLAFAALIASGSLDANAMAYKGGIMLMLGHGLSIALLFLLCGSIERSAGSLEYAVLGGLGSKLSKLAFFFGAAAMASIGLPGFANFPGEFLVFFAGFQGWYSSSGVTTLGPVQIATVLCLWGLVISAVYMLRGYRNVFQGPLTRSAEEAQPMLLRERMAAIILLCALVVIGIYPNIVFLILA